jgi:LPXTG-site transpeptidase (sortase) family protein
MDYRTLDSLLQDGWYPNKSKNKIQKSTSQHIFGFFHWMQEIKLLIAIFMILFLWSIVFTNANLFMHALWLSQSNYNEQSLAIAKQSYIQVTNPIIQDRWTKESYIWDNKWQSSIALDVETILENRLIYYGFDFNVLPPVDRLVIDSIALDVPLVSITTKSVWDFVNGDFDTELRDWVVKYPTTPMPWEWWNTLIFGHTSQEWREKNPYGTVFSNLPKLQNDDYIQLVWKWELYTYRVVETVIRRPKDVDTEFQKRQEKDKEYITLMWCYPLGTTKQRMMVMAERVY